MRNVLFWQSWPKGDRLFLLLAVVILAFTLAWLWYGYVQYPAPVIELQTVREPKLKEIPVDHFQKGMFEFAVMGNNYSVLERQLGSPLTPNTQSAYIYLVVFVSCIIGLLTIVTTLNKFYYLVGMGLFILLVVSLRLEILLVFGSSDKTFTASVIVVYVLTSFYIFYFAPLITFLARLFIFTAISAGLALLIALFAQSSLPFLHLATFAVPAGIIGSILFIVTVSHEILASFIYAVTQGTRQKKSLNHFLLISVFYLANLVLAYAVKFGFTQWDLVTIDLFLLLTISGILGIWGIRQRQKLIEGIIDVDPYGVFAFLLVGGICFGSIAHFLTSANDPVIDSLADAIIFSHMGYGLIFMTYIISNFIGMLAQNLPVHKVLYNPNNMPYFTFRFAGLIATLAFLFYNTWQVPVHNAMAGFHNANADLYLTMRNHTVARLLYEEGRTYGFSNHHSNYALANMDGLALNFSRERTFYESAAYKRPTEMAYLNWAQTFQSESKIFEAILVLKEGLTKFPESAPLLNTLALLHAETAAADSATYYLNLAENFSNGRTPEINKFGLAALVKAEDSAISETDPTSLKANKLALANVRGIRDSSRLVLPADTTLTLAEAAYINNYLLNHLGQVDTTLTGAVVQLARKSGNEGFREALLFSAALSWYSYGAVQRGINLLEEVTIGSTNQGKYNNILALWTLEQNDPGRALGYVEYAIQQNYRPAIITHAVALMEEGVRNRNASLLAWDSLRSFPDSVTATLANRIYDILSIPPDRVFLLGDEDKYSYCRYRLTPADSMAYYEILSTFTSEHQKARALLDMSQRLFFMDEVSAAFHFSRQIQGLHLDDKKTFEDVSLHEMRMYARLGQMNVLTELLKKEFDFSGERTIYKQYFDAMTMQESDSARASALFKWIGKANPFFDDGVLAAAKFFRTHGTDRMLPYNILVEGIQNHPASIMILKEYCLESARMGFLEFSLSSLQRLQQLVSPQAYRSFVSANREVLQGPREEGEGQ